MDSTNRLAEEAQRLQFEQTGLLQSIDQIKNFSSQHQDEMYNITKSIKAIKDEIKTYRSSIEEMEIQSLQNRISLLSLKDRQSDLHHQISSLQKPTKSNINRSDVIKLNRQNSETILISNLNSTIRSNIEQEKEKLQKLRKKYLKLENKLHEIKQQKETISKFVNNNSLNYQTNYSETLKNDKLLLEILQQRINEETETKFDLYNKNNKSFNENVFRYNNICEKKKENIKRIKTKIISICNEINNKKEIIKTKKKEILFNVIRHKSNVSALKNYREKCMERTKDEIEEMTKIINYKKKNIEEQKKKLHKKFCELKQKEFEAQKIFLAHINCF